MEKTGYFASANRFNVTVNFYSGNIFPLEEKSKAFGFMSVLYLIFVWVVRMSYFLSAALGSLYFADLTIEEALKRSGAMLVVFVEVMIPTIYLSLRRQSLRRLISKYNIVLIDSEDLRRLVKDTIEPYKNGIKFYLIATSCATSSWAAVPIYQIFGNDRFTYTNFTVPAYFVTDEPFGVYVFIAGILIQVFGSCFVNLGKVSIDVYVAHLIAVLTAEYKYIRAQLANALVGDDKDRDEASIIAALEKCIQHHSAVIEIGQDLTELLALHIGATYFTCVLKFCCLAFGVIKFGSAIIEKVAYIFYSFACMVQTFLVCSCVQELLDVSSSVTDDAFHENWHVRSRKIKKMFYTIEMSDRMECRLTAYRIVDLVVPTFASILSKSYSVCLLLLRID